jgi:hypothetical protein
MSGRRRSAKVAEPGDAVNCTLINGRACTAMRQWTGPREKVVIAVGEYLKEMTARNERVQIRTILDDAKVWRLLIVTEHNIYVGD